MQATESNLSRLSTFVRQMTVLTRDAGADEPAILARGTEHLSALIAHDDWLPDYCAQPHPEYYQQYLLHCDPEERFSVVSFVWGPGQTTPVHDHTVWGLVGMLRGKEIGRRFAFEGDRLVEQDSDILEPGQIDAVSPSVGDIHSVANAYDDRVSISIHVYGGNIGKVRRHVFDIGTGQAKDFVSGYANDRLPNLWSQEHG
ncbi:hypothetical protein T31B1_03350 [Salinisphaera sp. T31B1]